MAVNKLHRIPPTTKRVTATQVRQGDVLYGPDGPEWTARRDAIVGPYDAVVLVELPDGQHRERRFRFTQELHVVREAS